MKIMSSIPINSGIHPVFTECLPAVGTHVSERKLEVELHFARRVRCE